MKYRIYVTGTYDGLLERFREMRTICEDNPDGVFDMDL